MSASCNRSDTSPMTVVLPAPMEPESNNSGTLFGNPPAGSVSNDFLPFIAR